MVNPRKIRPVEGVESELVPLEPDELAQFLALFPGLIGADTSSTTSASIGALPFMWQGTVDERVKGKEGMEQEQKQRKREMNIRVVQTGQGQIRLKDEGSGGGRIRGEGGGEGG